MDNLKDIIELAYKQDPKQTMYLFQRYLTEIYKDSQMEELYYHLSKLDNAIFDLTLFKSQLSSS